MSILTSYLMYVVIFILAGYLLYYYEYLKKKKLVINKLLIYLPIGLISLLGSLRFAVGTDYFNYIRLYDRFSSLGFLEYVLVEPFEVGLFIIIKIGTVLGGSQTVFALYSFFTVLFFFLGIKYFDEKISMGLSIVVFLFIFYTQSFNIIRQYLAASILFYSLRFIYENQFKKYLICCIFSFMFHVSSIVFIPLYFLYDTTPRKMSKMLNKVFFRRALYIIVVLIFVVTFTSIFPGISSFESLERYASYGEISDRANNREFYIKSVMLMAVLLYRRKLVHFDQRNSLLIFMLIIELLLTYTGFINPFVKRIGIYYGTSLIVILPMMAKSVQRSFHSIVASGLILLYSISIFTVTTLILKQGNVLPYNFYFY